MEKFDAELTEDIIFPNKKDLDKSPEKLFSDKLKQEIMYLQMKKLCKVNPELEEPLNQRIIFDELAEFLREHILAVGKEQAIKDFQCGLNFLHKDIVALLKEDGDYGEKTFAAFYEVLQHYPLEVVKEAIIRGAKSNVGIDYEYSIDEEPETLIENVEENLNKEEI
ncbi:MAG: hypothetical protein VZR09_07385 [Candidatus Gastranaerophilaceae bacterium]|nr:hypothetical protein [Candidatus Gastranaerophilaceae bacterium]